MTNTDIEIMEKIKTILGYVPLIVTHNHITTFDEIVDTERTEYPKVLVPLISIVVHIYNHEKEKITSWIRDIVWSGATEETAREVLVEKGITDTEF